MWVTLQLCKRSALRGRWHNIASRVQHRRCADAAHTRSCGRKFMICSYWGDTHIYQEGSISPPCMVLLQSEQQEESLYFLSMERRCVPRRSPKAVNHSQSRFRFIRFALTKKKHASHHLKWFLIWACVRYTRQSMRKYKAQSRVTAEKCHKSSCLSSCIFKAECSQWLWVLTARPSVILQRESKPTVEITPTVMPGRSWGH